MFVITANRITGMRLVFIPVFLICVHYYEPGREAFRTLALWIYIGAAASDILDGWIARRWGQSTRLGRRLDPLADKLMVNLGYVFVAANAHFQPNVPLWAPPVFLIRDVYIVLGAYYINERHGPFQVHPKASGKTTTVLQMAAMIAVLLGNPLAHALLGGALAASCWSAADYFVAGYQQVHKEKNR